VDKTGRFTAAINNHHRRGAKLSTRLNPGTGAERPGWDHSDSRAPGPGFTDAEADFPLAITGSMIGVTPAVVTELTGGQALIVQVRSV